MYGAMDMDQNGTHAEEASRKHRKSKPPKSSGVKVTGTPETTAVILSPDEVSRKKWTPNHLSWTESPGLFFMSTCLQKWIQGRQLVLRNSFLSYRPPFPCYSPLNRSFTLGEIFVLLLCVGGTVAYAAIALVNKIDSESTGGIAIIPGAVAFPLAARNSIFTLMLGIPFERALFWHKVSALSTVVLTWVHAGSVIMEKKLDEEESVSGWVLGAAFTAFLLLSVVWIRRFFFNGFYALHLILIVITIISGAIHGAGAVFAGVAFWGWDLIIRYLILVKLKNPKDAILTRLPANIVRITFPKNLFKKHNFVYNGGQYAFIMIPKLNIFEWHPFSFSSSPHQDQVSFHIRVLGNWTRNLHQMLSENGGPMKLKVYIDGPYGTPEIDVDGEKYSSFLLVSGGIGITPLQSLCNSLIYEKTSLNRPIQNIWFVWSCADKYMISNSEDFDNEYALASIHPSKTSNRLPKSFQPDNLERFGSHITDQLGQSISGIADRDDDNKEDFLHSEFYLTRARKEEDYSDANIDPGVQKYLRFGRPDLPAIFRQVSQSAKVCGEKRIAVLTCGPTPLIDSVRDLCGKTSNSNVIFDFHAEVFQF